MAEKSLMETTPKKNARANGKAKQQRLAAEMIPHRCLFVSQGDHGIDTHRTARGAV
jgi:hypothetical protein